MLGTITEMVRIKRNNLVNTTTLDYLFTIFIENIMLKLIIKHNLIVIVYIYADNYYNDFIFENQP